MNHWFNFFDIVCQKVIKQYTSNEIAANCLNARIALNNSRMHVCKDQMYNVSMYNVTIAINFTLK